MGHFLLLLYCVDVRGRSRSSVVEQCMKDEDKDERCWVEASEYLCSSSLFR